MKLRLLLNGLLFTVSSLHAAPKADTNTVNKWNQQAFDLAYSDPAKGMEMAQKAYDLSRRLKFSRGEVRALIRMGIVYDVQSKNALAIGKYEQSLQLARKTKDAKGIASNYNNLGLIYWKMNLLDKAINCLNHAYEMFRQLKDEQNLASVSNNIGLIYEEQVRSREALSWHRKALNHCIRAHDNYMIYDVYSNLGLAFESLGERDSAELYTIRAIDGYRTNGNQYGLCMSLSNLGSARNGEGRFDAAIPLFEESMDIAKALGSKASYVSGGSNLCTALRSVGRYDDELRVLEEIQPMALALNNTELAFKTSYSLGEAYFRHGDFKKGQQMMKLYRKYHFSYFRETMNRNIADAEKKFQVREERRHSAFLLKEQREDRFKDNLIWGGCVAVLLLIGLLVFFVVRKGNLQRELANQRKVFDATTEERRRISYDLHDHVGSQLSYVVNNLELIQHLDTSNERVQRTFSMSQAAMSSLRDTVWALHSEELTLQSLAERMENVARKTLEGAEEVHLSFDSAITHQVIVPQQTTMHVMRIFQEAVHNVVKHAKATLLTVHVNETGEELRVTIRDNGVGISENPVKPFHYGLQSMKDRAAKIGGMLALARDPAGGTVVTLTWPKNNPNA